MKADPVEDKRAGMISQITLVQGAGLGELWPKLRQALQGRYVEIWSDVFQDGRFWVGREARAALEEAGIAFEETHRIPADRVRIHYTSHLRPEPGTLPEEDSVRARVLAGHGIAAALVFVGDGTQMPPEEPTDPKDALFYLSRPGARCYYLWRLFRSREDAEGYVVQRLGPDDAARAWLASIPALSYGELVEMADAESGPGSQGGS
jgi:hypothetical protein